MNLTAITDKAQVAALHFMDSLSIRDAVALEGKTLIDVGTGAGFPGIPLGIVCPGMKLTLLDSQGKRVDFLKEACALTGVCAACIQGRAEELGLDKTGREHFDIAVSRAVARLDLLCELCLPLVKPGGLFIAMKAPARRKSFLRPPPR
jgi:16S rRNA (guanine527-N7)-methyltransferase